MLKLVKKFPFCLIQCGRILRKDEIGRGKHHVCSEKIFIFGDGQKLVKE